MSEFVARMELNGVPATADDLRLALANNYGHFTALRVQRGEVRGLGMHLDRLQQATRELFAGELDRERVRGWLRQAVGAEQRELSVRINVFSRRFDRARPAAPAAPDVLVSVAPAPPAAAPSALRLKSFRYQREMPHIKHVGTFPLFHFRALAQRAACDDALFVGADGLIAEASIWNIGFASGSGDATRIVWPRAPQLDGVGMRVLQAGLAKKGIASVTQPVRLSEVGAFRAAFVTNASTVAQLVTHIDGTEFVRNTALQALLTRCHDAVPAEPI